MSSLHAIVLRVKDIDETKLANMFARINIFKFSFSGNQENVEKFQKRLVKVTKEHNDECKQLLKLMGIPYVDVSTTAKHNVE